MKALWSGRAIAWCAFVLGVAASVAANVAHARPELGPRLASAFAPVALLLTVEIMSRVPWPAGIWWRIGRYGGTGAVALVAAIMSYRHMFGLLKTYGEDTLTAAIGPLAVDGLMVVASLALLALGQHNTTPNTKPANDQPEPTPTEPPKPATAAPAPAPVEQPRPAAVVPVPASAFTRLNGTPAREAD